MFGTSHSNCHGICLVAVVDGESHQSSTACGDDSVVLKDLTGIHRGDDGIWSLGSSSFWLNGSVSKPCTPGEHQNSWDLWMFIPLKMVLIGIDPYPYRFQFDFQSSSLHVPKVAGGASCKGIIGIESREAQWNTRKSGIWT